jgi:hypothetical protein
MEVKDLKLKTLPELYLLATQYGVLDFFGKKEDEMREILKSHIEKNNENDETSKKESSQMSPKSVDEDDDIIDVEDDEPKGKAKRTSDDVEDDSDDDDEEDEKPVAKKKAKPVEDDDDDEEEEEKPAKKKAKPVEDDDEPTEDEEEEKPAKKKAKPVEEDEEEEAPKKEKRKTPEGFGKKVETDPSKTDNPFEESSAGHYVFKAAKMGGSMEKIVERAEAMIEKHKVTPPKDVAAKIKVIMQVINSGKKGKWGTFTTTNGKVSYEE